MSAARRIREARLALMLLTRLPVGSFRSAPPEMSDARWAYPLAGVPVALGGWAVLSLGAVLGIAPLAAGMLALTAMALMTGGLHHDGLADFADGMGGRDRARRLEIMRDSRVGSYGVLALLLACGIGGAALPGLGLPALLLAAVASRVLMLMALDTLPPARADGLGLAAARPGAGRWRGAWLPGLLIVIVLALWGGLTALAALALMALTAAVVARRALARLGGQTGDVLGAVQITSETVGWVMLGAFS